MTDTTAGAGERESCKNPVREALIAALRKAADEIAKEGHYGWGNVCTDAAEYLAAQTARRRASKGTIRLRRTTQKRALPSPPTAPREARSKA